MMNADPLQPGFDPIMADLMKINPNPQPAPPGDDMDGFLQEDLADSMEEYSLRLMELLDMLLEQKPDEQERIQYESLLKEHVASAPVCKKQSYPNDYLSRVLIDNFLHLLSLATLYFNLSLLSHVTRYCVKLIYSLECWEIYHLLHILPNLEYFLDLIGISVTTTAFGHIVKPPENYMRFNLRQGFQYPFPYPFYNFSYHTVDPDSTANKYARLSFEPYIDIRLKKTNLKRKRLQTWWSKHGQKAAAKHPEFFERSLHSPPVLRSQGLGMSPEGDFQKHQKVYIFMNVSPQQIAHDQEVFSIADDEVDEYDTDEAEAILKEEEESSDVKYSDGLTIVPSTFEKVLQEAEKKGIARLTTLHQCRLADPATNRPCLKIFYGKNELQRHQEFVHATKKKIYRCAYCEAAGNKNQCYPRHDSLARHIRRKHNITGKENKRAVQLAKQKADVMEDTAPEPGPSRALTDYAGGNILGMPGQFAPGQAAYDASNPDIAKRLPQAPAFLYNMPMRGSVPGPTEHLQGGSKKSDIREGPPVHFTQSPYKYYLMGGSKSPTMTPTNPAMPMRPAALHSGFEVPGFPNYGNNHWVHQALSVLGNPEDFQANPEDPRAQYGEGVMNQGYQQYQQYPGMYYPMGSAPPRYGPVYGHAEGVYAQGAPPMHMQMPGKVMQSPPVTSSIPQQSADQRKPGTEQRASIQQEQQHQRSLGAQQGSAQLQTLPAMLPPRPTK